MIFTEVSFKTWCLLIGAFHVLFGLAMLLGRSRASAALKRFPRSAIAGVALSTLAFLWAAVIVHVAPLDFIAPYKTPVVIVLLVCIPLSWFWMGDLLAARALGGLLCLLPAPVLLATRFLDSGWRLVMVVLMYVYAVAGMFFAGMPHLCRDAIAWLTARPARFTAAGAVSLVLGLLVLLLPALV
jgi:hypothetical protein